MNLFSELLGNFFPVNGPYLLMSDDVRRNRTSDTYYTNSLVKFDANSSVVPLTMYLASKRYGPIWMKIYYLLVYFNPYLIVFQYNAWN